MRFFAGIYSVNIAAEVTRLRCGSMRAGLREGTERAASADEAEEERWIKNW